MKTEVTIEPPAERRVTITLSESEAKDLCTLLGETAGNVFDSLYGGLVDALGNFDPSVRISRTASRAIMVTRR